MIKRYKLFRINILRLLIICCLLTSVIHSQPNKWYINKFATGSNNGTNWVNAWTSFNNITWSSIQPGDSIFISGGTDSVKYSETLNIGRSGSHNNNIIITVGNTVGHSGKVIIDVNGIYPFCIQNNSFQYVSIENIEVRNAYTNNIRLRAPDCQVKNCTFFIANGATSGIDIRANNIIIDGCYATTSSIQNDGQRDFIQSTGSSGHIFRNNYVRIKNQDWDDHCDVFQFYDASSGTIEMYNNILWQDNIKTDNAQGFYNTGSDETHFIFYNNVVIAPFAKQMCTLRYSQASLEVYNNTFFSGVGVVARILWISDPDATTINDIKIKNNIFYSLSSSVRPVEIEEQLLSGCEIGNNLFYTPYLNLPISYNGNSYTVSEWNSLPFVTNDLIGDPSFTNINNYDFSLNGNSLAIDAGVVLGGNYNFDIIGTLRPQGVSTDIGAYEYFNGTVIDIVPPELIGAEIIDSTTIILEFSEAMNESSVEDINNYAVNNGINILSATMNGNQVNLNTTEHSPGIYEVVVSNVTDLAGNIINNNYNSFIYEYFNQNLNLTQLPVVQADADHWYLNYTPDRTIDGIAGGESRWGGAVPMPDTIEYRLNDLQVLNQTKLSFYAWDSGRIYNYTIQVSIDSITWNEIKTNIPSHPGQWSVEEFDPVEAKYIRVILLSNNQSVWAGLWEAEFWGHLKIPTNNDDVENIPAEFMLEQNYPNPFNPDTKIRFYLPSGSEIKLTVFNILGEEVKTITEGYYSEGFHEFVFNASDLVSGVYVYRLESEKFFENKKMVYLK